MGLKRVHGRAASGGFSAVNRWDSNADVEPEGSTAMSRICVFSPVRELSARIQQVFLKSSGGGSVGWLFQWRNTQKYAFYIDDSGGTFRNAALTPTVIPKKGDCIVFCGSYNETNIHVYAKGESASAGPYVGFLPTNEDVTIGAATNGNAPAIDINVLACLATDTYALSVAQMAQAEATLISMLEQGQDIANNLNKLPGTGWNWVWDARKIDHAKGEWVDDVSGVVLSEVGRTQDHFVIPRFS